MKGHGQSERGGSSRARADARTPPGTLEGQGDPRSLTATLKPFSSTGTLRPTSVGAALPTSLQIEEPVWPSKRSTGRHLRARAQAGTRGCACTSAGSTASGSYCGSSRSVGWEAEVIPIRGKVRRVSAATLSSERGVSIQGLSEYGAGSISRAKPSLLPNALDSTGEKG
jgi:hypothetical protein